MKKKIIAGPQKAYLVGLYKEIESHQSSNKVRLSTSTRSSFSCTEFDQYFSELSLLAESAGLTVVGSTMQRRKTPHPRTYVGAGKLTEVYTEAHRCRASLVVFDCELTPSQLRNIEETLGEGLPVVDRTAVILDVFARHARTHEGKLQVELAQLEYRLPRLTRLWTHLARQAGGHAGLGVGLRGPGETQIEVDRRQIRRRLITLRKKIEILSFQRRHGRMRRERTGSKVIAVVGYTNTGKSTLMNQLTGADVYIADQLFATLDPTTRKVSLGSGRYVLMSDTVGFIQNLPHQLVAAFRSTLEEVVQADFLLIVTDASDHQRFQRQQTVTDVLTKIGAGNIPRMTVLNKIDLVEPGTPLRLSLKNSLSVSAKTGEGIAGLIHELKKRLSVDHVHVEFQLPYEESRLLGELRALGQIERQEAGTNGYSIRAYIPRPLVEKLSRVVIHR